MKIKAVIIDDEIHAIKQLEKQLLQTKQIEIIATYASSKEALLQLNQLNFDLLFLDIEMPQLNGFELLKQIKSNAFSVIFTTAYSQYAIEAFKYAAFDFLLKPISKDDINECINRWTQSYQLKSTQEQINYLSTIIDDPSKANKLTISTKDGYYFININEIIYLESDSNYTIFHLKENRKVVASKTLKEFESILSQHNFLRVHKSYLINQEKIFRITKGNNYSLDMNNGETIPVARNKQDIIKKLF